MLYDGGEESCPEKNGKQALPTNIISEKRQGGRYKTGFFSVFFRFFS
jgi:hypothetical protein